ncbi:hypothetical protein IJJ12_02325, partial [bacterium]|nr:hypothetical protein [bacterium]
KSHNWYWSGGWQDGASAPEDGSVCSSGDGSREMGTTVYAGYGHRKYECASLSSSYKCTNVSTYRTIDGGNWNRSYCSFWYCKSAARSNQCLRDQDPGEFGGYLRGCGNSCSGGSCDTSNNCYEDYYYEARCNAPTCSRYQLHYRTDYNQTCGQPSINIYNDDGTINLSRQYDVENTCGTKGYYSCNVGPAPVADSSWRQWAGGFNVKGTHVAQTGSCHTGDTVCYQIASCPAGYQEYSAECNGIFVSAPKVAGHYPAGPNGGRCGRCWSFSQPQMYVAGDTYAGNNIDSALPLTRIGLDTNRADIRAGADGDINVSYSYFTDMVDYDHLPWCEDVTSGHLDPHGFITCKVQTGASTRYLENLFVSKNLFPDIEHQRFAVFVEGDLTVDQQVIVPTVAPGAKGYNKIFLVRDYVTIINHDDDDRGPGLRYGVGADATSNAAPWAISNSWYQSHQSEAASRARWQGIYAAINFNFKHSTKMINAGCNYSLRCDNQMLFAGSLIKYNGLSVTDAMTESLKLDINFNGCGVDLDSGDIMWDGNNGRDLNGVDVLGNGGKPSFIFFYRPDLTRIENLPSWFGHSQVQRYESN